MIIPCSFWVYPGHFEPFAESRRQSCSADPEKERTRQAAGRVRCGHGREGTVNAVRKMVTNATAAMVLIHSATLLKHGTLKTHKDYPRGMITTQADEINVDLLAFIKG